MMSGGRDQDGEAGSRSVPRRGVGRGRQGAKAVASSWTEVADVPWAPCPYLPDRDGRLTAWVLPPGDRLDPGCYELLLAENIRRSGRAVYRPVCDGCDACRSLRVMTEAFAPTRSMRRVIRRNADLSVTPGAPDATEAKYEIYLRYLGYQHDGAMEDDWIRFKALLYESPTDSLELLYKLGERIVGVSLVDVVSGGLSSLYFYFDPAYHRRSLGTFSILWEIEYCRSRGLPYYYLGYYVAGAKSMAYKVRFQPCEILEQPGVWAPFRGLARMAAGLRLTIGPREAGDRHDRERVADRTG